MKIEIDAINGMVVVPEFHTETKVMDRTQPYSQKLKHYLRDELDECLGFEVTETEAMEIIGMGYGIQNYKIKTFSDFTPEQINEIVSWLAEHHKGHYNLEGYLEVGRNNIYCNGNDHANIEISSIHSKSGHTECISIDIIDDNLIEIDE